MIEIINKLTLYSIKNTVLEDLSKGEINSAIKKITDYAKDFNVVGNIWKNYIAYFIATSENAFSLSYELNNSEENGFYTIARNDIALLYQIYNYNIADVFGKEIAATFMSFNQNFNKKRAFASSKIKEFVLELDQCKTIQSMLDSIKTYYAKNGAGFLGLNKAFKIIENDENNEGYCISTGVRVSLQPIFNMEGKTLEDLVGYDYQKQELLANTQAFIDGRKANNVLLYGDGGTGKSSSVKAIINMFANNGLKIIEVYKHQFIHINDVLRKIKERNYKFILFMDDLSFEEFEIEYKYLKAVIEGGLESKPNNVLIYATSNRRHLIRETWNDKVGISEDSDVHRSDTMQEKLSLVSRFGLTLYYENPNRKQFYTIVRELANRNNLRIEQAELERLASQWDLEGKGKSGRSAEQFINYLLAKGEKDGYSI